MSHRPNNYLIIPSFFVITLLASMLIPLHRTPPPTLHLSPMNSATPSAVPVSAPNPAPSAVFPSSSNLFTAPVFPPRRNVWENQNSCSVPISVSCTTFPKPTDSVSHIICLAMMMVPVTASVPVTAGGSKTMFSSTFPPVS